MIIDFNDPKHTGLYIASGKDQIKVVFRPGPNVISAPDWNAIKESAGVKSRLAAGTLVIDEQKSGEFNIAALTDREAMDKVRRCIDPDVLRRYEKQERTRKDGPRPELHTKIVEQLRAVTTNLDGKHEEPLRPQYRARPEA